MFPGLEPPGLEIISGASEGILDEPTVWIGMPDGVQLAARIWRPKTSDSDPVPAILEYIPYRRRDARLGDDERIHPYFAQSGFASVRVDMRGSGDSGGLLDDEYLTLEQDDAVAVIAWIAAQTWCSGAVGMMGLSWGGFNSLQVAARAPDALKAIIAVGATVDRYNDDVHYKHGCVLNENFGWASSFLSFSSRPPDPDVVGARWRDMWLQRLNNLRFLAEPWFEHQVRDEYWQHGSVCENYSAITLPVMIVTGWADLYVNAVPRLLENLSGPVRAIAGPWGHQFPHLATPGPSVDFLGEARRWWERWLLGIENGVEEEPIYTAFFGEGGEIDRDAVSRPGRWLATETWPPPAIEVRQWHLADDGLQSNAGHVPSACIRSLPWCGMAFGELIPHCSGPEMAHDQRLDDGASTIFDSQPLEGCVDVWGDPVLDIEMSSNSATGQLIVRLCDVAPNGFSQRVTWGALNLCYREGDAKALPVPIGKPMQVRVALNHVAHRFLAGHRIRLALSTTCWPAIWPSPDAPVFVFASGQAHLQIPVVTSEIGLTATEPAPPRAPPLAEVKQLRPPQAERRVVFDQSKQIATLEITDDYGEHEIASHGMISGGLKCERYVIADRDPNSATADYQWTQTLGRGEWCVRTETETRLRCDQASFHLHAEVRAFEGQEKIFERTYAKSIRREPFGSKR